MRVLLNNTYSCSECNYSMHSWDKKCSKCGLEASTEIIKSLDSIVDIYNCNCCGAIVLKTDSECEKCKNIFKGIFHKCPKCEALNGVDILVCDCGYSFSERKLVKPFKSPRIKQKSKGKNEKTDFNNNIEKRPKRCWNCNELYGSLSLKEKICRACGKPFDKNLVKETNVVLGSEKEKVQGKNLNQSQNISENANGSRKIITKEKIPTKYLSFIAYVAFPLQAIIILISIFFEFSSESIVYLLFLPIPISLSIGIHKRLRWAYYFYHINLIGGSILQIYDKSFPLYYSYTYEDFIRSDFDGNKFLAGVIIATLIYLPHYFYIKKRKILFIKTKEIEDKKDETNTDKVSNSYAKTDKPTILKKEPVSNEKISEDNFDTFEKIKKLSELKDQNVLTEKEFEDKKKELLERI